MDGCEKQHFGEEMLLQQVNFDFLGVSTLLFKFLNPFHQLLLFLIILTVYTELLLLPLFVRAQFNLIASLIDSN